MSSQSDSPDTSPLSPDPGLLSVPERFQRALEMTDADVYRDFVWKLQVLGSNEMFEFARNWCEHDDPHRRYIAVDILSQLQVKIPDQKWPHSSSYPWREESLAILHGLFEGEEHDDVIHSLLHAFGHMQDKEDLTGIERMYAYADHSSEYIRFGLVHALSGRVDPRSIEVLIKLSKDPDDDVRNWATFGFGKLIEVDTPEIREALVLRLDDEHQETRLEAVMGLAILGDERCHPHILNELTGDDGLSVGGMEAAVNLGRPEYLTLLREFLASVEDDDSTSSYWLNSLKRSIQELTEKLSANPSPPILEQS